MFRVAIHIYGVAHPDFIPHALTPEQLAECMAFYCLEPWGPERDSWHAAQIVTACLQPWTKQRLHVKDHLLEFGRSDKPTQKMLAEKLKSVAKAIGARMN